MPKLHVINRAGERLQVEAKIGDPLMFALDEKLLVEATCGGAASCGTCHVYFKSAEIAGQRNEEEGYMLESLEDFVKIRSGSRLSCQVQVTEAHDGETIEIAPEA